VPSDLPLLPREQLAGLYARLGGEARLRAILSDFYQRMSQDLMIGFFFEGKDLGKIAHSQADFLMRAMGASPSYSGKPPAQAHRALAPILPGHFDRRLRILEEALKDHGLADEDIRTWIRFEEAFRAAVEGG
jgi:hemoglobin